MSNTQQKVRFIRPWQAYRVGEEIAPGGTLRDWLVGNGYVEQVGDAARRPAVLSRKAARKLADGVKASAKALFN